MDNSTKRPPLECELYGCTRQPNTHTVVAAVPPDGPMEIVEGTSEESVFVALKICDYHLSVINAGPDTYSLGATFTGGVELRPVGAVPLPHIPE